MTNPTPYPLSSAALTTAALDSLNATLTGGALPWLTTAYGKAQRLSKMVDGRAHNYPAIYTGGQGRGDYLGLFPDEHLAKLGGYSWWDVADPVTVSADGTMLRFEAGLVVWFDHRRAWPAPADWQAHNEDELVGQVINLLRNHVGGASITGDVRASTRPERVYPGLSHNDTERQWSMRPYGAFRLDVSVVWAGWQC